METANQYGIDLGNILSTVSTIKSAKATNALNEYKVQKMAQEEDQLLKEREAEQKHLQDPTYQSAASIKQATDWASLDKVQRENAIAKIKQSTSDTVVALTNISHIQDPNQQQAELTKYVQSLPPEVQQQVAQKYGDQNGNITVQSIPMALNDAMVTYKGAEGIEKENLAAVKAKTDLENFTAKQKVLQANRIELKDLTQDQKIAYRKMFPPQTKGSKPSKPTVNDLTVQAIMKENPGLTKEQAQIVVFQKNYTKTTTGDFGTTTTTGGHVIPSAPKANTTTKANTYNPKDVVQYGVDKSGNKVAKMKDGTVIRVK